MLIAGSLLGLSWLIFATFWIVKSLNVKRSASGGAPGKRWLFAILVLIGGGLIARNLMSGGNTPWATTGSGLSAS